MLLRRFDCCFSLFGVLLAGGITHEGHVNTVKMASLVWNGISFYIVKLHNEELRI